jgi:pilus assembly protein CpaC
MYDSYLARPATARFAVVVSVFACALAIASGVDSAQADDLAQPQSLVFKLTGNSDKLELTTNTSKILTLDKNIPRVQVNNPDLLAVTPLSANQVQISAKKAGVTQVNLWDDAGNIHTVDVLIYGDVRELQVALATQFPHATIKVYRYSESLVLKGYVDRPDYVSQIVQLANDYAPKVINNITVGGVQQVLLKVRVMEISRTKLRRMGVDWSYFAGGGGFAVNSISGLISKFDSAAQTADTTGSTFAFGVVNNNTHFFAFLDALQQNNIAKILAEPNIAAVSGRPAQFNVGGEIPIVVPQSLGTASIEFKPFGTQVDFLPIVLGNGNVRLEVRPRISEIDPSRSVVIQNFTVPALTVRQVDTAVEMKAGQTFALAGLVQERTEAQLRGLPYISNVPIIGVPFRKTEEEVNEIELLIMVTPEFVDAIDPCDAPCGGPGYFTTSPNNHDLYCGAHLEVPAHCNPVAGLQSCGGDCCNSGCGANGGSNCGCGNGRGPMMPQGGPDSIISDGGPLPGGTGYDESYSPNEPHPTPASPDATPLDSDQMQLPPATQPEPLPPQSMRPFRAAPNGRQAALPSSGPQYTVPRPYSPPREPVFVRNASRPNNPNALSEGSATPDQPGGLIGPIGYDAQ